MKVNAPHMQCPAPAMKCLACDYDLRSLTADRCPECGRAFDPADAATFRVGEQRTVAEDARRLAFISGALPLITVGALNIAWIAARLELGRWPEPHVDRASRIGGALDVILPATGVLFVLLPSALLVCVLAGLLALGASAVTRREVRRSLGTCAASIGLCAASIGYLFGDPQGILNWLFWDM